MSLSVVIIALNEERNLPRCLASVKWANEIIVVDSGSTDRTRQISKESGAKVFDIKWQGFGQAKGYGLSQATSEWILSIDADEEVSPELSREIQDIMKSNPSSDGYYMPRKTMFLGRWIYHCGWYPDGVLRLFRRSKGKFDTSVVHEKVILDGRTGDLKGELLHYSYPDLDHYFRKFNSIYFAGSG